MNSKTKKTFWITLLLLVVSGAAIGFYLFNKGPVNVKSSRGINIEAAELYHSFSTDSSVAQKKYSGKIVEVQGEINDISVNTENYQIVKIKTGTDGAYINCTMEENNHSLKPSVKIVIKGICSGIGEGDPDLGILGDVYLSRCYFVK